MSEFPLADKQLIKAKMALIGSPNTAFICAIIFSMRFEWDESIPTACIDGITISINPNFFLQSTIKQQAFVLYHEGMHVALDHITRCGARDHEIYNDAGDYVINQFAYDAHMEMYDWVLQENQYKGMSTNEVYDKLVKEDAEKDKEDKEDKLNGSNPSSNGNSGKSKRTRTNPMSGDVKTPATASEAKKIEATIKGILVKAKVQADIAGQKPGTIPGEIERAIEELINPVLPWDQLLLQFMNDTVKDDYSWKRPNRRFMPDFYMPMQQSDCIQHLTVAIDTSGSINNRDLRNILSEINYIHEVMAPVRMTVLDCDYKIHNIHEIERGDDLLDLSFHGGGGTSFNPVIKFCEEQNTHVLLYFTDLHATQITEDPDFPVIWLCYSNHKPAPIGTTIYYKPDNND